MSASDQERDEQREPEQTKVPAGGSGGSGGAGEGGESGASGDVAPESRQATAAPTLDEGEPVDDGAESEEPDEGGAESEELDENGAEFEEPDDDAEPRSGLAPRQARRLRIAAASLLMAAAAAVLAVRLASRSSVLVVGVYGLLLILCGIVIELSRRGRTRLGSWVLGTGLIAALLADWRLLP
ncbi:hypothetical protein RCO28_21335 [Streptomyces sp. LHD-70]|uniref:hypothetical protein n=1 Tax=Streptomyces sp. LHD-70 TaxID=3072140 RepID=UPI00280D165E|nr:hypothetical protein [Streptomyces sp. LHD-70]MDQ8705016.1 hypothetical protein [Streptomyces sp. LHD-70]